jgi:hypothetical protein
MNEKITTYVVPYISIITIAIDNHMAIIQVQVGKNKIDDVLLDGGSGVNIIIEQLRARLGLLKPKPTPYNLWMANQIATKPIGLIKDLRMYVHGHKHVKIGQLVILAQNIKVGEK